MGQTASSILLAIAIFFPVAASAAGADCPLRGTRTFQRKADLPAGAAAALGFAMAERGTPFQVTDVIGPGPRLPAARYVAGRGVNCTLIIRYERGGIAHTFETAIVERRGNHWMLVRRR